MEAAVGNECRRTALTGTSARGTVGHAGIGTTPGVRVAQVRKGRHMADLSSAGDEIVVFLIGMRINKPWKPAKW